VAEWHPLGVDRPKDPKEWAPNESFNEDKVKALAKAFWGWTDSPTTPFDTTLESFHKIKPGVWEVRTRAVYTG